jgi:hypothetical protein
MMVYRPKNVDKNQNEIVHALRQVGATVILLHEAGEGIPDLLIGFMGDTYLMEVKSKTGKLNPRQIEWHEKWNGDFVFIVRSIEDALNAIRVTDSDRRLIHE